MLLPWVPTSLIRLNQLEKLWHAKLNFLRKNKKTQQSDIEHKPKLHVGHKIETNHHKIMHPKL
jgi:hypothetical protein